MIIIIVPKGLFSHVTSLAVEVTLQQPYKLIINSYLLPGKILLKCDFNRFCLKINLDKSGKMGYDFEILKEAYGI